MTFAINAVKTVFGVPVNLVKTGYQRIRPILPKKHDEHFKEAKRLNAQMDKLQRALQNKSGADFKYEVRHTSGTITSREVEINSRFKVIEGNFYGDVRGLLRQAKMKAPEKDKLKNPAYKALRKEQNALYKEYGVVASAKLSIPGVKDQYKKRRAELRARRKELGSVHEKKGLIYKAWKECIKYGPGYGKNAAHRKLVEERENVGKELWHLHVKLNHKLNPNETLANITEQRLRKQLEELGKTRDSEAAKAGVDVKAMGWKAVKAVTLVGITAGLYYLFRYAAALQPKQQQVQFGHQLQQYHFNGSNFPNQTLPFNQTFGFNPYQFQNFSSHQPDFDCPPDLDEASQATPPPIQLPECPLDGAPAPSNTTLPMSSLSDAPASCSIRGMFT